MKKSELLLDGILNHFIATGDIPILTTKQYLKEIIKEKEEKSKVLQFVIPDIPDLDD